MTEPSEFQQRAERVQQAIERVNAQLPDDDRALALELLQAAMDLHGAALARVVELLKGAGTAGEAQLARLGQDPTICGLLVLYGLHPASLDQRVAAGLERLRPRLQKQGANVELLSLDDGRVRVRIESTRHGCGSNADTVRQMVEQAVLEVAPEAAEVVAESPAKPAAGFVPLNTLQPAKSEDKNYEKSTA